MVRTSTCSVAYLVGQTNIAHTHCLIKEQGRGPVRITPLNERLQVRRDNDSNSLVQTTL